MSLRKRSAFTLVELLVVISIIGMLMALLLPAVNSARERGRATVCMNNIRQLGMALITYENANRSFPGYLNVLVNSAGQPATEPSSTTKRGVSWVVPLLSYLERNDLERAWKDNHQQSPPTTTTQSHAVRLEFLLCPSDPPSEAGGTPLSYVANCGCLDSTSPSATLSRDYAANGVFHDVYSDDPRVSQAAAASRPPLVRVGIDYISRGDGTTNTLLLSENADAGSYAKDTSEARLGFIWDCTATPNTSTDPPTATLSQYPEIKKINGNTGQGDLLWPSTTNLPNALTTSATATQSAYARPSSYHAGTVHMVFADNHTSPISQNIDYYVYCLMMTPSGREVKNPQTGAVLNTSTSNRWDLPLDQKWINQ